MNDPDHVHYCEKCEHWYLCKYLEFRCESESGSVSSHRQHMDSMLTNSLLASGD